MCIGKSGHSTEHNTVSSEQYTDEDIEIETKKNVEIVPATTTVITLS